MLEAIKPVKMWYKKELKHFFKVKFIRKHKRTRSGYRRKISVRSRARGH